jgi:hypothetical protein
MDGKQPSFSFCILWMSICTHLLDENSPTSFFILHFTDEHLYLILWMKKIQPDFSFCIFWMSVCMYLLDENKPTGFFILHLMEECPGT